MKRNLYYFVYPRKGSVWEWNIRQLLTHIHAFNGTKIVAVAVDGSTEQTSAVARAIGDPSVTILEFENSPTLWENVSFISVLSKLQSLDQGEITFYAHAKGVRHTGQTLPNVLAWARAMYVANLEDIEFVDRVMVDYAAAGALRRIGYHGGSDWHFSGNFFWFKHATLFSRNWKDVHRDMYGVEGYIGRHVGFNESFDFVSGFTHSRLYEEPISEALVREAVKKNAASIKK